MEHRYDALKFFLQVAKNVDETKEAKQTEEKSPWKDLSTAIMEERWVEFLKTSKIQFTPLGK